MPPSPVTVAVAKSHTTPGTNRKQKFSMPQIEVVHEVPIYRNPDPGYGHVLACFSTVVQLSDHEFFCTYNRGTAIYATDLSFYAARSTDSGRSWPE